MKILQKLTIAAATLLLGVEAQAMRWYSPSTGRWLSRDPINESGFQIQSSGYKGMNRIAEANLYAFVGNDPVRSWDALGLVGEGGVWPPPPNEVNPPPAGPFKKCRLALSCHMTYFPYTFGTVPTGQKHCGLVIDTGDNIYRLDGSGGTENRRNLIPGGAGDATGAWTDNDSSVCECLFKNIKPWNDRHVPRDNTGANSNWNLKCMNNKCGVKLDWGNQPKPWGYDAKKCTGTQITVGAFPTYGATCCRTYTDIPCPD